MRLPDGDRAIVDERKIVGYCLSQDHDDGKHKARLFREILGITLDNAGLLLDALKEAAATGEAVPGKLDHYGQRYVIDFRGPGEPPPSARPGSYWPQSGFLDWLAAIYYRKGGYADAQPSKTSTSRPGGGAPRHR